MSDAPIPAGLEEAAEQASKTNAVTVAATVSYRSNLSASSKASHEAAIALSVQLAGGDESKAKANAATIAGLVASARLAGLHSMDEAWVRKAEAVLPCSSPIIRATVESLIRSGDTLSGTADARKLSWYTYF